MTSAYRREHIRTVRNDEVTRLDPEAQMLITDAATAFQALVVTVDTPIPSEGEKLALRRAMARFLIDSGIASARGWL